MLTERSKKVKILMADKGRIKLLIDDPRYPPACSICGCKPCENPGPCRSLAKYEAGPEIEEKEDADGN